jgi:hypothetical protein
MTYWYFCLIKHNLSDAEMNNYYKQLIKIYLNLFILRKALVNYYHHVKAVSKFIKNHEDLVNYCEYIRLHNFKLTYKERILIIKLNKKIKLRKRVKLRIQLLYRKRRKK